MGNLVKVYPNSPQTFPRHEIWVARVCRGMKIYQDTMGSGFHGSRRGSDSWNVRAAGPTGQAEACGIGVVFALTGLDLPNDLPNRGNEYPRLVSDSTS